MKTTEQLFKEFEEKFGFECYEELQKVFSRMYQKIEELTISRNKWKLKCKNKK